MSTTAETVTVTWRPTADEVAQLLRARTKDSSGTEVGAWTEDTRPTLEEVEALIDQACALVQSRAGALIAEPCASGAQAAAGLLAAMLVELSYWPEQVRSDRSAYGEYETLLNQAMAALAECIASGGDPSKVGKGWTYHSLPVVPAITERWYGGYGPAGGTTP